MFFSKCVVSYSHNNSDNIYCKNTMSTMRPCCVLLTKLSEQYICNFNRYTNFRDITSNLGVGKELKKEKVEIKNETVEYIDKNQNSSDVTTHSEGSESGVSSADDEITENNFEKKQKRNPSKANESKQLVCSECDKSFGTHRSYSLHKRSHQSKEFKCILCLETFNHRQSFTSHMKSKHPECKPFLCDYQSCQKSFKTQRLLKLHSKTH